MSADPNLPLVDSVVSELAELAKDLVLVGGCAVGLLVSDPARPSIRATTDVDLITVATPLSNYYRLCDQLRAKGFSEQAGDAPICRLAKSSLYIDIMPTHGEVLAGAAIMIQLVKSIPATPCSLIVGTLGMKALRTGAATPMILILPVRSLFMAVGATSK